MILNLLPETVQNAYYIVEIPFYDHDNLKKNVTPMKKLRFGEVI